jgi:hypothetical protein
LGPRNRYVSADWAGFMRRQVEDATGAPCLFFQGATADINPRHAWGSNDLIIAEKFGQRIAQGVIEGIKQKITIPGESIYYFETQIWLPLEKKATTLYPPPDYKNHIVKLLPIPRFMVDPLLRIRYPWKSRIENRNGYWSVPMVATILKLGALIWVSLGAEVFTEIGINIKSIAGSHFSFFSSLTNGCIGYLPTKEEHALGGYEVDIAPYFYRFPSRFQETSEEITMAKIENMLAKLL